MASAFESALAAFGGRAKPGDRASAGRAKPAVVHKTLFFPSHMQHCSGDAVHTLVLMTPYLFGQSAWLDLELEGNQNSMQDGVLHTRTFIVFLTAAYSSSWFCALELFTALTCADEAKDMVLVLETDPARDAVPNVAQAMDALAAFLNFNAGLSRKGKDEQGYNSFAATFPAGHARSTPFTARELLNRFRTRVDFKRDDPVATLREIFTGQAGVVESPLPAFLSSPPTVLIACNRAEALDQAHLIACILLRECNIHAAACTSLDDQQQGLPVILFCTAHTFKDPVVEAALLREHKSLVIVHEADGRRLGGLDGNEAAFWEAILADVGDATLRQTLSIRAPGSLAFSQRERHVMYSRAFAHELVAAA